MAFNNRFNDDAPANAGFGREFGRRGDPTALSGSINKPLGAACEQAADLGSAFCRGEPQRIRPSSPASSEAGGGCRSGAGCSLHSAAPPGATPPPPVDLVVRHLKELLSEMGVPPVPDHVLRRMLQVTVELGGRDGK